MIKQEIEENRLPQFLFTAWWKLNVHINFHGQWITSRGLLGDRAETEQQPKE